jgi:hypothetical protein
MSANRVARIRKTVSVAVAYIFLLQVTAAGAGAYDLGTTVADMRQNSAVSGGTSCPQLTRFDISTPGSVNRQWSTSINGNTPTILTADQTAVGQLTEIETAIEASLSVWTGVSGSALTPTSLGTLQRTSTQAACDSTDGINSICFNQSDPGFTLGVLAFTRVVSADTIGIVLPATGNASTFVGEIMDADTLLMPDDSNTTFATPQALASHPNSYDLESIVTHELGHGFGFNHSGVWSAVMFPFSPSPGQFTGARPTAQSLDAPLAEDDRTGLRVLYPNPSDSVHTGTIKGRVLPANPLALPLSPGGVIGTFPAQVVAVDNATGNVAAAVLAGWSCSGSGPTQFDGSFSLQELSVGNLQNYQIYAEPLDGPIILGNIIYNFSSLCRNASSDPGWPAQFACTVPPPAAPFSARLKPGP